jgi:tetratricopeptide (TPR) repeat protein
MFNHVGDNKSPDKSGAEAAPTAAIFVYLPEVQPHRFLILFLVLTGFSGCDRMLTPRSHQAVKDANRKAADGDFIQAINLYEGALDGSEKSAEIHYQMALLYDDKMNDPLNALHHFKRYLTLAPTGSHAAEVKNFMKRDELALITTLSGDSVVTRSEAARLRNENLSLRKKVEERAAQPHGISVAEKNPRDTKGARSAAPHKTKAGGVSYVVQAGDTLFSLSRQFYDSPDRWKEILEANSKSINDPAKLKVGQTLTIP